MKKIICVIAIAALMALSLSACGNEVENINDGKKSMFVQIETPRFIFSEGVVHSAIVYHKETKVMYSVSVNGAFTLLVNADGSPMRYTGR